MPVTHSYVSGLTDDPADVAAGRLLPSHWNGGHTVSVATSELQDGAVTGAKLASGLIPTAHSYARLVDEKAFNTVGGSLTGGTWNDRTLNTTEYDPDSIIVSLSSNQFTLAAGKYIVAWGAPAYAVGNHQSALYCVTDAAFVGTGSDEKSGSTDTTQTMSQGSVLVTIASGTKAYKVRHQVEQGGVTNNGGYQVSTGATPSLPARYTWVNIIKIG